MGRKPDGSVARNHTIALRVTANGLSAIDEVKGSWSRSEFIRRAVAYAVQHDLRGPEEET